METRELVSRSTADGKALSIRLESPSGRSVLAVYVDGARKGDGGIFEEKRAAYLRKLPRTPDGEQTTHVVASLVAVRRSEGEMLRRELEAAEANERAARIAAAAEVADAKARQHANYVGALAEAVKTGRAAVIWSENWHMDQGHEWAYETVHYVRPDGVTFSKEEKSYCG